MTNLTDSTLTDIAHDDFKQAFALFKTQGDFIKITGDFESGFNADSLIKANKNLRFIINNSQFTLVDTGVLLIEPVHLISSTGTAKNIIISAGIHGNETAPIEIVQQLVSEFITTTAEVKQRTLFIIGNPVSMNIGKRFARENLNRLFCGKHEHIADCYEKNRAKKLEGYVKSFFNYRPDSTNYHYDLHTAIRASKHEKFAIYPYQGDKPWCREQLSFMAYCGVNTILFGHGATGTFSYFSSANFKAHAFTIELGKVKPFGENDMTHFSAMINGLRTLVSQTALHVPTFDKTQVNLFKALGDITKVTDDFTLFVADDVENFTDFSIGTILAVDSGQEYKTKVVGESIVFPNANVGNGQRAALMVVPTSLE